jgi:hypothetical protein
MRAIHINSTTPFRLNGGKDYVIEDFIILTTVLSAMMWRKLNGSIKLYTDKFGMDYYNSLGLLDLWDAGIDTVVLDKIPDTVNQQIYWAAAKIFALQAEPVPVAMIDADLIAWQDLSVTLRNKQIAVIHREKLMPDIYLPQNLLKTHKGYRFDPDWDWTVLPCNAAFTYFGNQQLKDYYTACSIDFMTGKIAQPQEMVSQMVFAEQRLMAMCAGKMQLPVYHFLDEPFQKDNRIFTHIWGAKSVARENPKARHRLCLALLKKIEEHFPDYHEKIIQLNMFNKLNESKL